MTTHARAQIRAAVVTALTGLATTGLRVHAARVAARHAEDLPCLLVTTADERVEGANVGRMQQRDLAVVVRALAMSADESFTLDEQLDQIALEVEAAMAVDPSFGGLVAGSFLETVAVEFDEDADQPVGEIRLQYRLAYFVNAGAPGTIV